MICSYCAHLNPEGTGRCEACGQAMTVTCPQCQISLSAQANFCSNCGMNLQEILYSADPVTVYGAPYFEPAPIYGSPAMMNTPAQGIPPTDPGQTQLQAPPAQLLHEQSQTLIPLHANVIHIGRPQGTIPPDIDVSGLAHGDVVSRVHAVLEMRAGDYYIEDSGSSNGTFINDLPLPPGHPYRLRQGDRISLVTTQA
ncbi:FHA domain-containing protein [Lyngbya confervoides]|uniref:FHA domain-containing protein n=1 Tax=Lyngbya confervoides BDU141951 TaxID=1574623 RepID=A0ABD4T731_9CYAN|nr:FHA domain-containing protein [Lyngbya confervoides]MCM1984072.1 FHA domain-containing protein [Lyngbya confervoides BDU141951]